MSKRKSQNGIFAQRIGISLSMICAVHCVLVPFAASALPLMGAEMLAHTWMEYVLIITGMGFCAYRLFIDHRLHRSWSPATLATVGFGLAITAHSFGELETILAIAGSACILGAYYINWQWRRRSACAATC